MVFPAGSLASQAVVLVDGQRVECRAMADDRLVVPLAGQRDQRRFVIELQYHFAEARPPRGALRLEFPHLGPNIWVRRMYWQLILPANEHVTANPAGFTGEFTWDWEGYFWGRQPLLDQAQLESWVGAAPRPALPDRDNLYLFSTLGDVRQAEIHTAGRTWIVLWASGAVLLVGLVLIYVPASRHPGVLLVAGLGLLAAGLIAPEPTFLLAQAASLGLGLTLLTGFFARGMSGRRRRLGPRKEPLQSRIEVGSTRPPQRPARLAPGVHRERTHGPAATPGECRAMKTRAVLLSSLAAVLLAATAGLAAGAEGEAAGVIRFRRIFVPADRTKDWPVGDGKYLPVEAAEFERLTAAAQVRGGAANVPLAVVTRARYEAKLVGDHLAGQAALRVVLAGPAPAMLPLEPCNLALGQVAWDAEEPQPAKMPPGKAAAVAAASGSDAPRPSPVILGVAGDGRLAAMVDRSGQLRFDWSLAGHRYPADVLGFVLEVPRAPADELWLVLPNNLTPAIDHGLLVGNEPAGGAGAVAHRVGRPPSAPPAHPARRHGQPSSATGPVAGVADVRFFAAQGGSLGPVENSGP